MRGDILAGGGTRAQFPSSPSISQDKWSAAFDDFDPEEYKAKVDAEEQRRSNARVEETGDVSAESGENIGDPER